MEQHRRIRSFVRREGRLTTSQQHNLDQLWPQYGLAMPDAPYNWNEIFGRQAKRTLEIGFGAGESLCHQATQYPEQDFIGIEVYRSGLGRLMGELHQAEATNVKLFGDDAEELLPRAFANQSVDQVLLYFPDPWPKKRHHKRRIVKQSFADEVARILAPNGIWRLATDWDNYAEQMREVLDNHPAFTNIGDQDGWVTNPPRVSTRFERRGLRKNHNVYDMAYQVKAL